MAASSSSSSSPLELISKGCQLLKELCPESIAAISDLEQVLLRHAKQRLETVNVAAAATVTTSGGTMHLTVKRKKPTEESKQGSDHVRRTWTQRYALSTIGNGVTVRESVAVPGQWGLFATRPFTNMSYITEYTGRRMPTKDAMALASHSHVRTLVTFEWVIDGSRDEEGIKIPVFTPRERMPRVGKGGGAFANDPYKTGQEANAQYQTVEDPLFATKRNPDLRMVVLQARRDISAGEEILVPYGAEYWIKEAMNSNANASGIASLSSNLPSSSTRYWTLRVILPRAYKNDRLEDVMNTHVLGEEVFRYFDPSQEDTTTVVVNVKDKDFRAVMAWLDRHPEFRADTELSNTNYNKIMSDD